MKQFFKLCLVLAFAGLFVPSAIAQNPVGSIEGVITDGQGAVVSGATVTVTSKATGQTLTTTTSDDGFFAVRQLTPNVYTVKVEQAGFSTASADNVVVQVGLVARTDIALTVGNAGETVNVDIGATDIQVDTSRQAVDGVITSRQITALPLNERNFLDLAQLQPGVTVVDGGNIDPTKSNAYRAVRVNGGSGTSTRVQIEGIDVTDETVGTTIANVSTDGVQEFNLSRSSFDLSTSLTTSGAVSIATRTGGNQFTGSAFYFKQDDRFDARPGFSAEKPEFNRSQMGYRFGGPIWKDRIFFFSNGEKFEQQDFTSIVSGDFPSFSAESTLPIETRYLLNRFDFNLSDNVRAFYLFNFNDDDSTGGTIISPYQTLNFTSTHVAGLTISGSKLTSQFRFGYVNFNNNINSSELDGFPFPTISGQPYQLNVGDLSVGPNSLAPQQTFQDNFNGKYDGTYVAGNHILRAGIDVNRFILGGFANFAGPLTIIGDITTAGSNNPLDYLLQDFTTGPQTGFFTAEPAHGYAFGGKRNTRYGAYVGDQWKVTKGLTLNMGLRWNYESNYFNKNSPRLPQLDFYAPGLGDVPTFPKTAFSPQLGFAWDPFGNGKTSIRGGFYLAYEGNIFNNSLLDEFSRIRTGIGPTVLNSTFVVDPNGVPINVQGIPGCSNADTSQGNYECLVGRPISQVLPFINQINARVQSAYSNIPNYDPNATPTEFSNTRGVTNGGQFPGDYKIPYSMQFNIGFQHEIFKGHVLAVDYVRQRGVGLPLLLADLENRLDSRFFDAAAARTRLATVTGIPAASINPTTFQAYLNANPNASISTLGLGTDTYFTGQTVGPNRLTRARVATGGFSLYSGLQISLNGRIADETFSFLSLGDRSLFKGVSYTVGYAFARNTSTGGSARPEFINNTVDNRDYNRAYGPSGLDRKHNLTVSVSSDIIGGFRLDQIYRFQTSPPLNLVLPNNRGASGIFTSDINGDGGVGTTPRGDLLPGTNIGDFGRRIGSISELNNVLATYNAEFAGRITPAGRRLIDAGFVTEAQLIRLGAVTPLIPLVPENNPDPFQNLFVADYRLSRPIRIWKESWILEPSFSVFNVFNNAAKGTYGGLSIPNVGQTQVTNFGAINYNYDTAEELSDLEAFRGLRQRRRQLQFGIRFSF